MNAVDLKQNLLNWTLANSGAECRTYLGMSAIGNCPLQLYNNMIYGRDWTTGQHLMCYEGYLHERDILDRLQALNGSQIGPGRELSAFGGRFQGHTDGEWDGDLLEIKSTRPETLNQIWETGRLPMRHFWQVQCYMHYGHYRQAYVIYKVRDTGDLYVARLRYLNHIGEKCHLKASAVLEAVDHQQPPECECGRCEMFARQQAA
jgi:hypothetical protein